MKRMIFICATAIPKPREDARKYLTFIAWEIRKAYEPGNIEIWHETVDTHWEAQFMATSLNLTHSELPLKVHLGDEWKDHPKKESVSDTCIVFTDHHSIVSWGALSHYEIPHLSPMSVGVVIDLAHDKEPFIIPDVSFIYAVT